jgi:hypothetical protein
MGLITGYRPIFSALSIDPMRPLSTRMPARKQDSQIMKSFRAIAE